jgi:hypothetical protein
MIKTLIICSDEAPVHESWNWTLDRVKLEISQGTPITGKVVDIGNGQLVKFGTFVSSREAEATKLIAAHTSIPVPTIHATLYDETTSITYIVQEKLQGCRLDRVLENLDANDQHTIEQELKDSLSQLSMLDTRGTMGMVGAPMCFIGFHPFAASLGESLGSWRANTVLEFVTWLIDITNTNVGSTILSPLLENSFDSTTPSIFSHGDLVPENILINEHLWNHRLGVCRLVSVLLECLRCPTPSAAVSKRSLEGDGS